MDRKQFWRNKYRKEHMYELIISLVFSVALVFILQRRSWIVGTFGECVIAFLVLVVIDLLHFIFRMNSYVNQKLEEERKHEESGYFGEEYPDEDFADDSETETSDGETEAGDGEIQE